MHFNFHFSQIQVLWTLTFAALLVLLIVLLGRERIRRFPWFTASIVVLALRLLTHRLLFGKLPQITLNEILIVLGDVLTVIGAMVVVELARRAFAGAKRTPWIVCTVCALAVAGMVVAFWGQWPPWKTLTAQSQLALWELMQLASQKLEMLANLATIELTLLVALFGRRYGAGWRSHTQMILIGLSTKAIAQFAIQGVWQLIATRALHHSDAELERLIGLREKLVNANGVIFVAVLVWWIVVLWIDEPGTKAEAAALPAEAGQS
jgi:asparagine N-glycosylation enzyme membrane subunit Stt3